MLKQRINSSRTLKYPIDGNRIVCVNRKPCTVHFCCSYWWLRIQNIADNDDWKELDKFSKLKKSPIGYAPFVDVCLQKHNHEEAMKYLPRVSEEIKVKYYVKAE